MESKHTPGPWRVGNAGGTIFGPPQEALPPRTIAHVDGMPSLPVIHGEKKANARLIAAAPDLLAALEALVAVLDDGGWIGDNPEPGSTGYAARAAIAKARGE